MGLEITKLPDGSEVVIADARLWFTAGKDRLVADGDPDAASLFSTPGKRIPRAEAERFGLVDAEATDEPEAAAEATQAEAPAEESAPPASEPQPEPAAPDAPAPKPKAKRRKGKTA
jgi:hypothetical protein